MCRPGQMLRHREFSAQKPKANILNPQPAATPSPARAGSTGNAFPSDATARFRRGVYLLLIALSVGNMLGRIFAVNSVDVIGLEKYLKGKNDPNWNKSRPFLSAN